MILIEKSKVCYLSSSAMLAVFPVSDKAPLLLSIRERAALNLKIWIFFPNFTIIISNYAVTIVGMIDKSLFS